jgi:hypothetical protein
MVNPNTPNTPTNADALENKKPEELQTMLQTALSDGKYEEAKKVIAELERKNTDFEMKDENGKPLSERFTDFLNKKGARKKDEIKAFFEDDIKTYIGNTETKIQTVQEGKNNMIASLMDALNDKDKAITDITKERDEAINTLPRV